MEDLSDFSAALLRIRTREIEGRVAKLINAGVPLAMLTLGNNEQCDCQGTGILLKATETSIFGGTCQQCLGVNMVIDRRSVA